jgi:hypothetical protein
MTVPYLKYAVMTALLAAVVFRTHEVIYTTLFLANIFTKWQYMETNWYKKYLRYRFDNIPMGKPMPIPEIHISEYSHARMLEVTDNFRLPIILRGALNHTASVKKWSLDYLMKTYPNDTVLVRFV